MMWCDTAFKFPYFADVILDAINTKSTMYNHITTVEVL